MTPLLKSKTLSVSIQRPPGDVYAFIANPENLPRWVPSFIRSVAKVGDHWMADTPGGKVAIQFVAPNPFGVLDHYVMPAPGVKIFSPMRVLPNGDGSEVIFTLFQRPELTDEMFMEDAGMVQSDLSTLKSLLEA